MSKYKQSLLNNNNNTHTHTQKKNEEQLTFNHDSSFIEKLCLSIRLLLPLFLYLWITLIKKTLTFPIVCLFRLESCSARHGVKPLCNLTHRAGQNERKRRNIPSREVVTVNKKKTSLALFKTIDRLAFAVNTFPSNHSSSAVYKTIQSPLPQLPRIPPPPPLPNLEQKLNDWDKRTIPINLGGPLTLQPFVSVHAAGQP